VVPGWGLSLLLFDCVVCCSGEKVSNVASCLEQDGFANFDFSCLPDLEVTRDYH
jgi:hypothetical protein